MKIKPIELNIRNFRDKKHTNPNFYYLHVQNG